MKLRIFNVVILSFLVCTNVNCYFGTQRDTCKYNLHESTASGYCEILNLVPLANNPDLSGINYLLLNCYQYYERLKECNKEENRYIPSIYGINSNPVFSPKGSSMVFHQ